MAVESSRIFVRGLPSKLSEDDVRKHFSLSPPTDVKWFPHRRISYVGYQTPADALKAVKYYNRTFLRMSKLHVEIARPITDEALPKSRRQQKDEKSALSTTDYVPPPKENPQKRKRAEDESDNPKLQEFLEVMQPKKKRGIEDLSFQQTQEETSADTVDVVPALDEESDDDYQVISKSKLVDENAKLSNPVVQATLVPVEDVQHDLDADEGAMDVDATPEGDGGPVSDADWLRSRTNRVLDLVEDDGQNAVISKPTPQKPQIPSRKQDVVPEGVQDDQPESPNEKQNNAEISLSEEDKVRESGRLYLRNLSWDVQDDDLREHFSEYPLKEVHVSLDKKTGKPKGFAFITFENPDDAVEAFRAFDNTIYHGRLLHLLAAAVRKDPKLDEFEISKLPLKKQRELRRKAEAASATFNWNSLFLNADAVMSSIAERLGVAKSDVLDPTASDAAVKQAQAETHLINELRTYFASHGVDLDSFSRSSRGKIAILMKNIPHSAGPDEVRKLLEEHGKLTRFLMPPSGLTSIAEFSNTAEAQSAFKSLNYRKFKESLLYLEWAPKELFQSGVAAPAITTLPSASNETKLSATDLLQEAPEPDNADTATLYVRNLNFSTTTDRLTQTFSPLEGFRSAVVRTKIDPKRGVLSMGFGFCEFSNAQMASAALRAMDGYSLDGHKLSIKVAHKGADAAAERRKEDAAKKSNSGKILVKNLPFEASKKDVRALFAPFGQVQSVRVPKKFDNTSRGFAFVSYLTHRDAANAIEALKNTHLLGRRLVLSYAEAEADDPEQELEKMQEKVGAQANKVALQRLTGGGRKKFNVAGTDDLDEA